MKQSKNIFFFHIYICELVIILVHMCSLFYEISIVNRVATHAHSELQ